MSRRDRGGLRPHTTRQRPYMPTEEPEPGPEIHVSTEKDFTPSEETKVDEVKLGPAFWPATGGPPKPAPPKVTAYPSVVRIHEPDAAPELRDQLRVAKVRIDKLEKDRDALVDELVNLVNRVADVETRNAEFLTALHDAMADRANQPSEQDLIEYQIGKILAFMREHAGMRFTGLTIAENLPTLGMTNSQVGSRLQSMFRRDLIRSEKRPNRTTMYWAEATS